MLSRCGTNARQIKNLLYTAASTSSSSKEFCGPHSSSLDGASQSLFVRCASSTIREENVNPPSLDLLSFMRSQVAALSDASTSSTSLPSTSAHLRRSNGHGLQKRAGCFSGSECGLVSRTSQIRTHSSASAALADRLSQGRTRSISRGDNVSRNEVQREGGMFSEEDIPSPGGTPPLDTPRHRGRSEAIRNSSHGPSSIPAMDRAQSSISAASSDKLYQERGRFRPRRNDAESGRSQWDRQISAEDESHPDHLRPNGPSSDPPDRVPSDTPPSTNVDDLLDGIESLREGITTQLEDLLSLPSGRITTEAVSSISKAAERNGFLWDQEVITRLAQAFIKAKDPISAKIVIGRGCTAVKEAGQQMKAHVFETAMSKLVAGGLWRWVMVIGDLAGENLSSSEMDMKIVRMRIESWIISEEYVRLESALALFHNTDLRPDERIYSLLMRGFLENRDVKAARRLLRQMCDAGIQPGVETYVSLLRGYKAMGGNEALLQRIFSDRDGLGLRTDRKILNSAMSLKATQGDHDAVWQFADLFDWTVPDSTEPAMSPGTSSHPQNLDRPIPDVDTFTILLRACAKIGSLPRARRLWHSLFSRKLKPNQRFIAAFLQNLVSARRYDEVNRIMKDVRKMPDVEIGTTVFNSILLSRIRQGRSSGVIQLLQQMTSEGVEADDRTIALVIREVAAHLNEPSYTLYKHLMDLLNLSQSASAPSIRHLNAILSACLTHEKTLRRPLLKPTLPTAQSGSSRATTLELPGNMQWIVESLVKRKVRADPATSAIALRRRAPFVNDPSTLWNDLQTNVIDLGMMPSIYHITAIQQAYLEVGDIQGIRDAMRRAKEMGVPMCPAFFNILMNAHIRKYQIRQAYEVYGSMKTVGVEPNFHCVALMAHGWAKIGEVGKVEELVNLAEERFRQSEPFPNPSLVACLYRAYWESGDDLGAQKMLRKALVKGLRPDGHVFTLMMRRTRTYLARKRARRAELGSSSTPLPPTSDAHNTRHVTPSDAEHTHPDRLVLTQRLQRRNELVVRRRNDYHRVADERAREMLRVIIKHWPRKREEVTTDGDSAAEENVG